MVYTIALLTIIMPFYNDAHTQTVSVHLDIPEGDFVHYDHMRIYTDNPNVEVIKWESSQAPIKIEDATFQEEKKVFDRPITLNITLEYPQDVTAAHLHLSYYRHQERTMQEDVLPIALIHHDAASVETTSIAIDSEQAQVVEQPPTAGPQSVSANTISCYVQNMVEKTNNVWLRILLVLLLGLLMSLTPCIYPMIPITIGILQSQGSTSMLRNFLLALSYTMGIATMFASLGLLAASTGQMFGAIMANPIVILCIVALLAYLAFSMLGFYEMYVPRFMAGSNNQVKSGSLISVFLFGVASGSVASPCLSPGLILLLTIVTALKSKILGFVLLFAFGIGLSLPLLVVGTFSSALNALPRAGVWMVEIKKVFGVMLIGMCFYFLNMIMPWYALLAMITLSTLLFGLFYLHQAQRNSGFVSKTNNLIGMLLIAGTIPLCIETYKAFTRRNLCPVTQDIWNTDYQCARDKAIANNKPILLKVGGPCCSMCTAIDGKQFADTRVLTTLEQQFIPIKVDGSQMNQDVAHIKKTYTILGFPTILAINPHNETIIKKWGGDLYDVDPQKFAQVLEAITVAP